VSLPDSRSQAPRLSGDGSVVVFSSNATDIVDGAVGENVFARNLRTGETTLVSITPSGTAGYDSGQPAISGDGRFVAFVSGSRELVPEFADQQGGAFLRDLVEGTTWKVSLSTPSEEPNRASYWPSLSEDGRFVSFTSWASNFVEGDRNGKPDIFVYDRQTGGMIRASVSGAGAEGNGTCLESSLSANGRFVAFTSEASNLVEDDRNGQPDVFVHDRLLRSMERVSVSSLGEEGNGKSSLPRLSGDGRLVVFVSEADNLVPGDTNRTGDVFVRDRIEGRTWRANVTREGLEEPSGAFDRPGISTSGRYISFLSNGRVLGVPWSDAPEQNAPQAFRLDTATGAIALATMSAEGKVGDGTTWRHALSAGGGHLVCYTHARNLNPPWNTFGVMVAHLQSGTVESAAVTPGGTPFETSAECMAISGDGRFAVFPSGSTELVPGDTNGKGDVFLRDLVGGSTMRLSITHDGSELDGDCANDRDGIAMSADGRCVAFQSAAKNLVPGQTDDWPDIFVVALDGPASAGGGCGAMATGTSRSISATPSACCRTSSRRARRSSVLRRSTRTPMGR